MTNSVSPCFAVGAVLVVDFLQKALDSRDEIDLVIRDGVAGRFQIGRDRLLQRISDTDLRRRRRDVRVLFLTGCGDRQRQGQHREAMQP